jgi:hypothetical protein
MNPNSRTIKVIESSLARLEAAAVASPPPAGDAVDAAALDALGLLDEIRRLERKWVEQIAAASPRRKPTDYAAMEGWCRRWLRATSAIAPAGLSPQVASMLTAQRAAVERDFATDRFRAAANAMLAK